MSSTPKPSSPPKLPNKVLTATEYLRGVVRSGLIEQDELDAALEDVPDTLREDTLILSEHLIRKGKLTRFQASKLLRGISQGMILGPYRILAPIGQGGMGKVFLVRDSRSDQLLALKILPPRQARTEERMLARFRREMEMSKRVAHPHLAWTSEVGELRGVPFIAMEYIPGQTLSRVVEQEGPLPIARAARLMAEVASGLEHAHNQGLVHRDLKPSNIQITPRDHAKVLDLGLALIHGEVVTDAKVVGGQNYIVGSMDYIAPEQTFDASAVDRRGDIYSLGCTLYFALTGRPPFPGGSAKDKILRHRNEEPEPIANLVEGVPIGFVQLLNRIMAKDPNQRHASAKEVEEELRSWTLHEEELPIDTLSDLQFDESVIIRKGPGSSDYSHISLPEMPVAPPSEDVEMEVESSHRAMGWYVLVLILLVVLGVILGGVALYVLNGQA
jgi:serine/threonine protein kinase